MLQTHEYTARRPTWTGSKRIFNKEARFFVLDDVISSFDKRHRVRFGQLLDEKFSDYQILLFTHEWSWFEFMAVIAKRAGWKINQTHWDAESGISLNIPSVDLKEQIDAKLQDKDGNGLGNLLRKCAERMFKELCVRLEAEVKFQFNDRNERRMADELFSSLRGRLRGKSDLADSDAVKRVAASKFIFNQASHDAEEKEDSNDLKAAYTDLLAFEGLFTCVGTCKQRVSTENMNKAKKAISCKCGEKEISWKE